eukprot:m.174092 g.174092  ORF g.174092 m.174092 type:complete len:527 (+) comp18319_c0_seq1:503-2083(+)
MSKMFAMVAIFGAVVYTCCVILRNSLIHQPIADTKQQNSMILANLEHDIPVHQDMVVLSQMHDILANPNVSSTGNSSKQNSIDVITKLHEILRRSPSYLHSVQFVPKSTHTDESSFSDGTSEPGRIQQRGIPIFGNNTETSQNLSQLRDFGYGYQFPAFPSKGCDKVYVETIKPGGLCASLLKVIHGMLDSIRHGDTYDYVIDMSKWSYQCKSNVGWECYFKSTIPCTDILPSLEREGSMEYERIAGTGRRNYKYFQRKSKYESLHAHIFPVESNHQEPTLQLRREVAGMVLKLKAETQEKIRAKVQKFNISSETLRTLVTVHIRRGDKTRESHKSYLSGNQIMHFLSTRRDLRSRTLYYVLSDDANAVKEFRAAAPGNHVILSGTNENQSGFNECLLPTVRNFRKGPCDCKQVSEAAKKGFMTQNARQKSYCFVNPQEQDPQKLISILDNEISEEDAAMDMLTDAWIASRSAFHVAVGCGSNVDKLIKLLRSDDPNNVICLETTVFCKVNELLGTIAGLDCKSYV